MNEAWLGPPETLMLSRVSGAWLGALAWVALCCSGCGAAGAELEQIDRVPVYVLTPDDLRGRVGRLGSELGVATEGVLVHGQFTKVCAADAAPGCVAELALEGGRPIPVVVIEPVDRGRHYVLRGAVVAESRVPDRWVFRANVLAVVRD
jgi:hypothetical protein